MPSVATRNKIDELNRATPGTANAQLGTLLENLITQINALKADVTVLSAQNSRMLSTATLAIKAGGGTVPKTTTACTALASGVVQTKASATDMSVIAGTLATAKWALWAFYIDNAGTITTSAKTADAASAAAALALKPAIPAGKAEIGYIIVGNASGSGFVGGTTALDAANITTTYVSNDPYTPTVAAVASLA
jgi:hypothetical protein